MTESFAADSVRERHADMTAAEQRRAAWLDLVEAATLWRLALDYALAEIKRRYRLTRLGPLWNSFSSVFIGLVSGLVLARAFNHDLREFLPYAMVSLCCWGAVVVAANEASECYVRHATLIRAIRFPASFHALRLLTLLVLTLAHDFAVVFILLAAMGRIWIWLPLALLPALLLWVLSLFGLILSVGVLGVRFRETVRVGMSSMITLLFLITPLLWYSSQLGPIAWVQLFNPVFVMIELLRRPMLGEFAAWPVWIAALAWTVFFICSGWLALVKARAHIVKWC
jgi:lipopolysaccharide transport system permease protein